MRPVKIAPESTLSGKRCTLLVYVHAKRKTPCCMKRACLMECPFLGMQMKWNEMLQWPVNKRPQSGLPQWNWTIWRPWNLTSQINFHFIISAETTDVLTPSLGAGQFHVLFHISLSSELTLSQSVGLYGCVKPIIWNEFEFHLNRSSSWIIKRLILSVRVCLKGGKYIYDRNSKMRVSRCFNFARMRRKGNACAKL